MDRRVQHDRDLPHPQVARLETLGVTALADADREVQAQLRKKDLKRQADTLRPLDSWERYRALNDAMDEAFERIDISNREGRFALILMGGLNAAVLVAATRSEFVTSLSQGRRLWAGVLLAVYAIVALYFLLQAIEALRPAHFRPRLDNWRKDSEDYPVGVRYFEDVITKDAESYWKAWREVRISQVNAELAVQLHSLCLTTDLKRHGLRRLYSGLRVMAILVAVLLALIASSAWQ